MKCLAVNMELCFSLACYYNSELTFLTNLQKSILFVLLLINTCILELVLGGMAFCVQSTRFHVSPVSTTAFPVCENQMRTLKLN